MTAHPIDYDALRELAEKATPGPWESFGTTVATITGSGSCQGCSGLASPAHEPYCYWSEIAGAGEADAAFIAASRTAIPALLDALERAESERDEARSQVRLLDAANDEEIDARDAAEHRATRAEAQSEARRINTDYWKGVARATAICSDVWKESAEEAQSRIKAVRDVLAYHGYGGPGQEDAIRRALDA